MVYYPGILYIHLCSYTRSSDVINLHVAGNFRGARILLIGQKQNFTSRILADSIANIWPRPAHCVSAVNIRHEVLVEGLETVWHSSIQSQLPHVPLPSSQPQSSALMLASRLAWCRGGRLQNSYNERIGRGNGGWRNLPQKQTTRIW